MSLSHESIGPFTTVIGESTINEDGTDKLSEVRCRFTFTTQLVVQSKWFLFNNLSPLFFLQDYRPRRVRKIRQEVQVFLAPGGKRPKRKRASPCPPVPEQHDEIPQIEVEICPKKKEKEKKGVRNRIGTEA